jgi:endonuclease/exonuclease/phosphatase family metal-dependent hydrolase
MAEQAQLTQDRPSHVQPHRGLRLLSYNIQAGIDTNQYRDYLTKGWRHVLPSRQRLHNLDLIARMLRGYDLVGLQEVDAGSLRSGFLDMTEYLANRAGYPYWYRQVNRDIGMIAQNSNGVLSRMQPNWVGRYRLPPGNGRGAMVLKFGQGADALYVCTLHLALSRRLRRRQFDFIADLFSDARHVVIMGDMNASCDAREFRNFVDHNGFKEPACSKPTFPSWRPVRRIDHILVSEDLQVRNARVLDYPLSDHLPVSVELVLPERIDLAA